MCASESVCACIDIVFININVCKAPGPSPGSGPGPCPCPGTCAPDEILILFYLGFCLAEQNLREVNHTTLSILPISKDEENGIKTPSDCGSGRTLFGVVGASSTLLCGVTLDCFWLILMDLCSRLTHAHTHTSMNTDTDTPLNTYVRVLTGLHLSEGIKRQQKMRLLFLSSADCWAHEINELLPPAPCTPGIPFLLLFLPGSVKVQKRRRRHLSY